LVLATPSTTLEGLPCAPGRHLMAARSVRAGGRISAVPTPSTDQDRNVTMSGHARPQSNSPWVIDTRALGRRPGTLRALRLAAPVDEPMGLDVVAVPPGSDVDLDLRLEAVAEGVLVSGTAAAVAVGQCSRCLIDLTEPVIAKIRELYAYPESTTAATTDDDELPRLVDDLVDLEPLVRDEVVLALPMAPLCRPDCPGLCAECGERFDDLEPGHSHEILDPRWAALRDRFDTETPESTDRPHAGSGE
jgi:uncharacterized protein